MKKLILISVLMAILIVPGVEAALVVQDFKCKGETTLTIENNEQFYCQAVILNNDPSSSVTTNEIVLDVSGNWAESNTYSGSGFSSTISAGGTTTATFEGIRTITPGNNHKFSDIDIDGTTHTEEVSSAKINAIVIKTLTLSSSSSSVATSSEFIVTANILSGGDFDATLTLTPSNCELKSGESASKSVSLAHNSELSRSWTITMGSSDCSLSLAATGPSDISLSDSASVTNPSPSTDDSSAAGSTGSGAAASGGAGAALSSEEETESESELPKLEETTPISEKSTLEKEIEKILGAPIGAFFGLGTTTTLALFSVLVIVIILIIAAKKRQRI
ncbi:MAG: hypothetical protein ISS36_02940 [Candidatus Aenigmarchaeota archaeon]|nr:hypothetical protein [Candidatus Aenigmarchaeota archaeon]